MRREVDNRRRSPIVERRWLGAEMRRFRQARGWTQVKVAKELGWQTSKVSMLEGGQRPVPEEDIPLLLDLYEVPREAWDDYVHAAEIARRHEWWDHNTDDALVEEQLRSYTGYEQGASRLRTYQPGVPHGLLQTPDYTAELLKQRRWHFMSSERIHHLVQHRATRQQALARETDPLAIHTVIDIAALRRVVGSSEVMRAQLTYLADTAQTNPNVTVQVVPDDHPGAFAAHYGPFTIIDFPPDRGTGIVFIEQMTSATFKDSLSEIDRYSALFEQLAELALSPEESLEAITHLKEEVHETWTKTKTKTKK